jgi:hypothetical protein
VTYRKENVMPAATVRKPLAPDTEAVLRAETVDRIARFHGGELPVVSLYAAVDPGPESRKILRTKVDSLLHELRPLAADKSLAHDVRVSFRQDIERIEAAARRELFPPGTIVMFSCSGGGLFEAVSLPRPLRDRILVDATPWIRPLLAVLDEYQRALVAVVDRSSGQLSELYLGRIRDAGRLDAKKLRKPTYGGWHGLDEHRVRNKAEELSKRHLTRSSARIGTTCWCSAAIVTSCRSWSSSCRVRYRAGSPGRSRSTRTLPRAVISASRRRRYSIVSSFSDSAARWTRSSRGRRPAASPQLASKRACGRAR